MVTICHKGIGLQETYQQMRGTSVRCPIGFVNMQTTCYPLCWTCNGASPDILFERCAIPPPCAQVHWSRERILAFDFLLHACCMKAIYMVLVGALLTHFDLARGLSIRFDFDNVNGANTATTQPAPITAVHWIISALRGHTHLGHGPCEAAILGCTHCSGGDRGWGKSPHLQTNEVQGQCYLMAFETYCYRTNCGWKKSSTGCSMVYPMEFF